MHTTHRHCGWRYESTSFLFKKSLFLLDLYLSLFACIAPCLLTYYSHIKWEINWLPMKLMQPEWQYIWICSVKPGWHFNHGNSCGLFFLLPFMFFSPSYVGIYGLLYTCHEPAFKDYESPFFACFLLFSERWYSQGACNKCLWNVGRGSQWTTRHFSIHSRGIHKGRWITPNLN